LYQIYLPIVTGKNILQLVKIILTKVSNFFLNYFSAVGKDVKGKTHTFYQTLIDERDCPFIVIIFKML
jgi:hypothetical protein